MLVVVGQDTAHILEFLGWLYRMGIVVIKDALAIGFVQRQRITDAVRRSETAIDCASILIQ
ncbi:hypothetical protein ACZ75_15615 [Massilia sp. NR 4-1]|nr:hypothetical protein ACZ75_15615 [Massilia sp. NR 4-1]